MQEMRKAIAILIKKIETKMDEVNQNNMFEMLEENQTLLKSFRVNQFSIFSLLFFLSVNYQAGKLKPLTMLEEGTFYKFFQESSKKIGNKSRRIIRRKSKHQSRSRTGRLLCPRFIKQIFQYICDGISINSVKVNSPSLLPISNSQLVCENYQLVC